VSALPFNRPLSPARRLVWAGFDLRAFLGVRGAAGCKVNDVALAVIAGALRRYLGSQGVATDGLRVRAMVPVSVRGAAERLALGNLVSALFPRLPLDAVDPAERLRRVVEETTDLKRRDQARAMGIVLAALGSVPTAVEALLARLLPDLTLVNTICTNVAGPRDRCTIGGVPIVDVHPYVPLYQSMGMGFAVLSYADRLSIGVSADPTLVPEVDTLPRHLYDAFAELAAAVAPAPSERPAEAGPEAAAVPVAALMTSPVLTVSADDTLERAWLLMARARVRHLPVVDRAGRLIGLVTHRDLLAAAPRGRAEDPTVRLRLLGAVPVREVMETHLTVATPELPAAVAGASMVTGKIGALPVVGAGGRLVGILTTDDLVRWATARLAPAA
jgi:CBS domain-containing protein